MYVLLPLGQLWHDVLAAAVLYWPTGQAVHLPEAQKLPAGQLLQDWQDDEPAAVLNVPAAQAAQDDLHPAEL